MISTISYWLGVYLGVGALSFCVLYTLYVIFNMRRHCWQHIHFVHHYQCGFLMRINLRQHGHNLLTIHRMFRITGIHHVQ